MGLAALGISANMLTSTTSKDEEKLIYKALEKGEGDLKILYVTPEKISKSKRFMSKLEKCHHAGRLSLISIDVSVLVSISCSELICFIICPQDCPLSSLHMKGDWSHLSLMLLLIVFSLHTTMNLFIFPFVGDYEF